MDSRLRTTLASSSPQSVFGTFHSLFALLCTMHIAIELERLLANIASCNKWMQHRVYIKE